MKCNVYSEVSGKVCNNISMYFVERISNVIIMLCDVLHCFVRFAILFSIGMFCDIMRCFLMLFM